MGERLMSVFIAQESPSGNAVIFGFTRFGVEIAIDVSRCQKALGSTHTLAGALSSEDQIDEAVKRLTRELEATAAEAKELLKKQQGSSKPSP